MAPPPVAPPGAFGEGGEAGAGRFDPPLLPAPGEREAGPTYYRLSDDAWAQIRAEYLGGSTAKALSAKWGVSAGTVYRRAQEGKWTKEQRGAAVSAAAVEAEVASRAGAQARREALAERDAAEASEPEPEPEADPLEAARLLLRRAAGAAQAGRLEAATERVKLAEGLARAARALGLDAEGGWEEEPEEEEGSPEELEALREDVERRYRRFDRAPAEAPPTAEPVALLPEPAEWRPSPPPPEPPVAPAPVSPFPSWAPSFEACWRAAGGGRP